MEPTRGPEFFKPVGEVGTTASDTSGTSQTHAGGASSAPPDSVAAEKLWADVQAFIGQAKPLLTSCLAYLRAHVRLTAFVTQEKARLAAARFFLWCGTVAMLFVAWIFFSIFLWRAAITLTHEPAMGPLVLVIIHAVAAFVLWSAQKRLKL